MGKYKFNIDKKIPSDEQIDKHKDFKKLLYNYQKGTKPLYKTPLYKKRKVYLVVLLILLIVYLVVEFSQK